MCSCASIWIFQAAFCSRSILQPLQNLRMAVFRSPAAPVSSDLAAASEHAASDREELNHIFPFSPSQMHRFELN